MLDTERYLQELDRREREATDAGGQIFNFPRKYRKHRPFWGIRGHVSQTGI